MISVTFTADVENIVATEHLYQWDNGQKLSISGVGTTADIHFANKKSEKALVVTPTVTSGAMEAPIPNSLLAEPYPIIAYVYVPSDNGARTIKSVIIYVEARKQPSDFVLEEDEGITTLESISQRANAIMSSIQTDYNNFKNTIQAELDDMVANTTIPNADTLDGHHADEFAFKTDIPTSLPANGGNANTVGNNPISQILAVKGWFDDDMNNLKEQGSYIVVNATNCPPTPAWGTTLVFNGGTGSVVQLYICSVQTEAERMTAYIRHYTGNFWTTWRNTADGGNANTANTAGTLATTPTNACLRNISFGTADPQVTDSSAEGYVAPGALYGQYEEVTT